MGRAPKTQGLSARARLWAVGITISLVLSIAFPVGVLARVEAVVQPVLAYLGIDVSNTPLTADMMMMYDPRYRLSLYRSRLDVRYRASAGEVQVPWRELSFYGWRVPSILFIENVYWNLPVALEISALCRELERLRGPGEAFAVATDLPAEVASLVGLNRWYACR